MTDRTEAAVGLGKRPKRIRRWVLLAIVLSGAGLFSRFAYLRIALHPTPRLDYWEAKLAAIDPSPPTAMTAGEAEAVLSSRPWEDPTMANARRMRWQIGSQIGYELDADDDQITAGFSTAGFQKARSEIIQAINKGWRRGLHLASGATDFEGACRDFGVTLIRHALWLRERPDRKENQPISEPDLRAIQEDWLAVLHLGRQLGRDRHSQSILALIAIEDALARDIKLAAHQNLEGIDVRALALEVDANRLKADRPSQYIEGERLALYAQLEEIYVREGSGWIDVSQTVARSWYGAWGSGTAVPSRAWNLTSPLFDTFDEACARIDRSFEYLDRDDGRANGYQLPPELNPTLLNGGVWFNPQDASLTLARLRDSHTALDTALTELALRAYRTRNGRYPDSLNQLVPDYLPHLPVNHTTKQPLYYTKTDKSYQFYASDKPRDQQPSQEQVP